MSRRYAAAAVAAVVLLTPLVTWSLVGDLSCECPLRARPLDRMFEGPNLSRKIVLAIAIASTVAFCLALAVTGVAVRRGVVNFREIRVAVPLVIGGMYIGLTHRVVTAGVIGANIGGGMMLLAAPIVAIILLAWALSWGAGR